MLAASVPFIGANARHAQGNNGEGVVVAILDSGVDTDHPDLSDDIVAQACFGDNNFSLDGNGFCPSGGDRHFGVTSAEDNAGHGSHVAGIVTSRGTVSSVGVAPGANIVAIKVLDGCAFSGCFYAFSEIVAALDYIIQVNNVLGVKIINMSIGTNAQFVGACDNSTAFNMAGAAAINTLRNMGVIAFASAGNNGSGLTMPSPACLSNVVSVGATNNTGVVATFSQSNSTTDIFAPGVAITSLSRFGTTAVASGTSMASPHAAGCAALLVQAGEAITPAAIEARLETSPFMVTDPTNGLSFPRIDCSPDIHQATMDLAPSTISLANTSTTNAVLLSTATFNATTVVLPNVRMRVNSATDVIPATRFGVVISSVRDWNGDGLMDRLVSFRTADLVAAGLTAASPNLVLRDNISAAKWEAHDPAMPAFVP
jgi:subtilisin family serine protease